MGDGVIVERHGAARWLIIDREERKNALNETVLAGLREGVMAACADSEVRAIVITGAGRVFCAGGDLKPDAQGNPFHTDPSQPNNPVVELFKAMENCNLPIIARVNGHALGGGFGLMCACDMAIAVDGAKLGTPEVRLGLFPAMILPYMIRVLPRRILLEMCTTGELLSAAQAAALHVVNHAVAADQLDAKVAEIVGRIEQGSPTAIRLGKYGYHAIQDMTVTQALDFMQVLLPQIARTEDSREGFKAFNERRRPDWTGR